MKAYKDEVTSQGQTAGQWQRQEYKHELYCHSARGKG